MPDYQTTLGAARTPPITDVNHYTLALTSGNMRDISGCDVAGLVMTRHINRGAARCEQRQSGNTAVECEYCTVERKTGHKLAIFGSRF